MNTTTIQTVIADDEPKARKNIQRLLKIHPEFEIISSCSDGGQTLEAIRELNPDLVFLDIQMPEYNGFELLEKLDPEHLPVIVFVTAYDEFALQAFEVHAVDYLMKPFDKARFEEALDQVKKTIRIPSESDMQVSVMKLLEAIKTNNEVQGKIKLKNDGKIFFLDISEIRWIEAAGNYIKIVCENDWYMDRNTMKNIEKKLDSNIFFRIHRSAIINIHNVKVIKPWFHGDYKVIMQDGTKLNMSRNYTDLLDAF